MAAAVNLELDPIFLKALGFLHSKSKDSAEKLKALLDESLARGVDSSYRPSQKVPPGVKAWRELCETCGSAVAAFRPSQDSLSAKSSLLGREEILLLTFLLPSGFQRTAT